MSLMRFIKRSADNFSDQAFDFEKSVRDLGLPLLCKERGFTPSSQGAETIIGVATWDIEGVRAFQSVSKRVGLNLSGVFNLDDCSAMSDLQKFIPGVEKVLQSPVVVLYENGQIKSKFEGKAARDWMEAGK